MNEIQYKAW